MSSTDPTIKDFEAAIAELESIVKKLEEGDLPLETSLQLYERGELKPAPSSFSAEPSTLGVGAPKKPDPGR